MSAVDLNKSYASKGLPAPIFYHIYYKQTHKIIHFMGLPVVFFWYFHTFLTSIQVWIVVSPPNYQTICFSPVLSKVFFWQKTSQIKLWYSIKCSTKTEFRLKIMTFVMKNRFVGSMSSNNTLEWLPPRDKVLGLDEPYLTTP